MIVLKLLKRGLMVLLQCVERSLISDAKLIEFNLLLFKRIDITVKPPLEADFMVV